MPGASIKEISRKNFSVFQGRFQFIFNWLLLPSSDHISYCNPIERLDHHCDSLPMISKEARTVISFYQINDQRITNPISIYFAFPYL